jgi:hypothetical protein
LAFESSYFLRFSAKRILFWLIAQVLTHTR